MKQKNSDNKTLSWLWARAKGKKRYVALLIAISTVMGVLSVGYALFLSGIVDAAVAKDWELFYLYSGLLIAQIAVQFALRMVQHFLEEYSKASLENAFKRHMFRQLLTGDYAAVTATHSGEWLSRLTSDTVVVANAITGILPGIIGMIVRLVMSLGLMFFIVPIFGIGFIVGGAAVMLVTWLLRRGMKKLHKQVQVADGALRVFLTERLGSMMILRAFGQEDSAVDQGTKLMNDHKTARMKKNHISNVFHTGFSLIVNVVYVLGAIYCGYGILTGTMSYGSFTAMLQLVSRVQQPIGNISSYLPQYSAMLASAERLMEVEKYATAEEPAAVENMNVYYSTSFRGIGLRNAGFTYMPVGDAEGDKQTQPTVLKNLNLEIAKGEYVAFCGPSGCGKSTVLKLLMSMYELDEGVRYLTDGEGEKLLTTAWRGLFAYVPQGNQLMSGTIREVVSFAAPDRKESDEQIWRALTISCADQFISELPDGLDTQLGERGAGLSEGQMQRIAIARAVFSERPILLLDEATSALDEQTEAQVLDNLRSMTDKTVIIVTHRPKALEITDKTITFNPNDK
ncbi:MAG: ABC transporter ATP-binding protein [Oscillospiraceae bacterium]|nr:ABC transporter ATP-binding protein [Oscillospiraceae bacterium]